MTDEPIPCVRPFCPPVERFTVTWTLIRCPECGVAPYGSHSIFDNPNHDIVWTCPEHGVIDFGELELEADE